MCHSAILQTVIRFYGIYQSMSRDQYVQLLYLLNIYTWFNYEWVRVNSKYINGVIFKCVWTSVLYWVTVG